MSHRQSQPEPAADSLARFAAKAGWKLPEGITRIADTGCDACDRPIDFSVDELAFHQLDELCDDHRKSSHDAYVERVLGSVLPEDQRGAQPNDLLPGLQSWNPSIGGVYLYGPAGRGKTHMAVALVKKGWSWWRREHGSPPRVVWRNALKMRLDVEATFSTKAKYDWSPVMDATILVLDDFAFEDDVKDWWRSRMYGLIEYRLQNSLCTIITGNCDLDGIADLYSAPIASRLTQMCAQVSLQNLPDRRIGKAPRLDG